jgi:hypothetical protein
MEFIRDGRLRTIAVTTAKRSELLPELVPGYAASGWYGICAPRATPTNVVS